MKISKKNLLVSAASVVTAATLLFSGATYAYLQDETEDKVNTFNPNKVLVDIAESGEGKYDIIPGKTDTKDPKVIVDNTVPAYVYVEVTDNTDDLVTWTPADGWQLLDGTDNVYYREVEAKATPDAAAQEIYFLEGNQVSYDKAITNDKMINADGSLKEGFTLEFRAYAIQKEGFADAKSAWLQVPAEVATVEDFTAAIASGKSVKLTEDIALTGSIPKSADKETEIDLGTKTITVKNAGATQVGNGESLTVKNGNLVFEGLSASNTAIGATEGSNVTLENVNITSSGACVFPTGQAEVNVKDCVMNSPNSYCISTNASRPANYNSRIHLQNSEFNGNSPILINVPCELIMDNCTVNGEMHGVIIRGGTAVLNNCTINNVAPDNSLHDYFDTRNWGQGNTVTLAGITIGNKVADTSTSYQYPSNVTLNNTTVTSTYHPTIYIWGNNTEANGVTLNYDAASSVGTVVYGGGCAVVNGTVQTNA